MNINNICSDTPDIFYKNWYKYCNVENIEDIDKQVLLKNKVLKWFLFNSTTWAIFLDCVPVDNYDYFNAYGCSNIDEFMARMWKYDINKSFIHIFLNKISSFMNLLKNIFLWK